jgi:hypothetical protein
VADLNTLMNHLTPRMRAAGMEGFIPAIGEGYGMENALILVICQDPDNPGVKRSGELSFTNDVPPLICSGRASSTSTSTGASRSPGMPFSGARWARRTMTLEFPR